MRGLNVKPLIVLSSIAAVSVACASPSAKVENPAATPTIVATVTRAETTQLFSYVEAGGVLRARLTSAIASRVMAPIAEVRVRPGDRVTRGQVLVVLDGRDMRAQSDRAAAALTAAQQGIRGAESDQKGAAAALALAAATHDRMSRLSASRSATAQELDEAIAALRGAEARVAGADAHAAEAAAGLKAAEASLSAAAITLSYTTVTSPFDGIVADRTVDPGMLATPGAPLLTVEDTSSFRLEVRLDESRASGLAVGQQVPIRLDSAAADDWKAGRVSEISRLDPTGHGFVAKIDVPPSLSLRSGAFGRARIATATHDALTVPASAVIRRGQMTFVFAVDGENRARLRPVSTGPSTGERTEILAGLSAGESLVANPSPALTDGARVSGDRR
jgi:multidrug efflux pump subunit AcrA (membrane-fusion protein)